MIGLRGRRSKMREEIRRGEIATFLMQQHSSSFLLHPPPLSMRVGRHTTRDGMAAGQHAVDLHPAACRVVVVVVVALHLQQHLRPRLHLQETRSSLLHPSLPPRPCVRMGFGPPSSASRPRGETSAAQLQL